MEGIGLEKKLDLGKTSGRPPTLSASFWKKNPDKNWSTFSQNSATFWQNLRMSSGSNQLQSEDNSIIHPNFASVPNVAKPVAQLEAHSVSSTSK